ncbi:MAG: antA/AntB antirepressor family protein [Neisseria sp.]|nr:antA/AntB antirepressor family protein [Neisseria sp.]
MNSKNLIPVFNGQIFNSQTLLCDARKLHKFLQVETRFNMWIQRRIEEYGFIENQDFLSFAQNCAKPQGGRKSTEYHLTLDMAKELAMVERNEQGRAARRYFIECEKRLAEQVVPSAHKKLPALIKKRIRCRDDLSFTRRDVYGKLINWQPPTDDLGMYDWYEAYAIGEKWFAEIIDLTFNNPEEAYFAIAQSTRLMTAYVANTSKQGLGFVEGFFERMARHTLAGILAHRDGITFPFASGSGRDADLTHYLGQAEPQINDDLFWQAWNESAECRLRCYQSKLAELAKGRDKL